MAAVALVSFSMAHRCSPEAAGSGESDIRRYVLENDLVEAIIGLPTDMFYNTGISTYVWIVSNRKPAARKGQGAAHRRQQLSGRRCEKAWGASARNSARSTSRTSLDCLARARRSLSDGVPISRLFRERRTSATAPSPIERPQRDEKGKVVFGLKGKPVPDAGLRDTEQRAAQ